MHTIFRKPVGNGPVKLKVKLAKKKVKKTAAELYLERFYPNDADETSVRINWNGKDK